MGINFLYMYQVTIKDLRYFWVYPTFKNNNKTIPPIFQQIKFWHTFSRFRAIVLKKKPGEVEKAEEKLSLTFFLWVRWNWKYILRVCNIYNFWTFRWVSWVNVCFSPLWKVWTPFSSMRIWKFPVEAVH